jgi:Cys-rich protein (TIGR01571 family)
MSATFIPDVQKPAQETAADGTVVVEGIVQSPNVRGAVEGVALPTPLTAAQLMMMYHPVYPRTTCCVRAKYLPMQRPGKLPIELPPFNLLEQPSQWHDNLGDCCTDVPLCLEYSVYYQCHLVQLFSLMSVGYSRPSCGWYFLYFLLDLLGYLTVSAAVAAEVRVRVAQYFHINVQNHGNECLTGYFCCWLSNCQVHRELTRRGVSLPTIFAPTPDYAHVAPTMK